MTPEHYEALTENEREFLLEIFKLAPAALGLLKEQTILTKFYKMKVTVPLAGCQCTFCKIVEKLAW